MAKYKCVNLGGTCSKAESGEIVERPLGGDNKCDECHMSLSPINDGGDGGGGSGPNRKLIAVVIGAIGIVMLTGVGVYEYKQWSSDRVVVLKPDSSPVAVASIPISSAASLVTPAPTSASVAAEPAAIEKPAPMVANEVAARKTCDEAVKAKQRDADKVCRRATAITLMNSGTLSAINGKLDQAERDYLAAKDKDPDFPELYFNLAVLKARQNKGSEAVDNLNLASAKGFTQFSAIKGEPALQKLKSDPALKSKIEAFEVK